MTGETCFERLLELAHPTCEFADLREQRVITGVLVVTSTTVQTRVIQTLVLVGMTLGAVASFC